MKPNTFTHLENLCRAKRIVCERYGKRIELTTPDGSVKAECATVAEALDTVQNDSTFFSLPTIASKPAAEKVETYTYTVRDGGMKIRMAFHGVAILADNNWQYGVTWEPTEKKAEHAALVAVAEAIADERRLENIKGEREADELNTEAISLSIVAARGNTDQALANLAAIRNQG